MQNPHTTENTVLVLVDVQGALAQAMADKDALVANLVKLVAGIKALELPIIWMEQIPEKMGNTIPELVELLPDQTPLAKSCFSCCGSTDFTDALTASGRSHVLLAGIEAHVCVYQTAVDLAKAGYRVDVVANGVSSRSQLDKDVALKRIAGYSTQTEVTTVEMALFDLMRTSEHPSFRDVLRIVK